MRKHKAALAVLAVMFVFLWAARGPGGQAEPPAGEPGQGVSPGPPRESALPVSAEREPGFEKADTPLPDPACQALREIIALIDGKDYEAYAARTDCLAEEADVEGGVRDRRGIFNLQAVRLARYLDITEMPEARGIIDTQELRDAGYRDIRIYTVELDCRTYREDRYFFDGLNYFIAALGTDGEACRLLQFSQPVWKELPEAARILGLGESVQIFIQNERMKGNIIGSAGNLIETNRAGAETPETACADTGGLPVRDYLLSLPASMGPEEAVSRLSARLEEAGVLPGLSGEEPAWRADSPEKTYIGEQAAYWTAFRSGGTGGAAADGEYGSFAVTDDGENVYRRNAESGLWVSLDAQA